MEETLDSQLTKLLTDFRYESSIGRGQRGLQAHHIEALKQTLMPFIQPLYEKAWMYDGLCK
jgi:hypothetical protein